MGQRLSASRQRFGTTRRQRNEKVTPSRMRAYVARTYGQGAAAAWDRGYEQGGLLGAGAALAPYRYPHHADRGLVA